jgi:putative Mg2+ transporter-C (MgtC) family protein
MLNAGLSLLNPSDWLGVLSRIGLALIAGGLVGFERELDHKPAGLRTHMLVSLGAALFVISSIETGIDKAQPDNLSRIIQGLIAGIGFLGAGEIFSAARVNPDLVRIQGLTSAAAIWVSAALGTAAGCGLWFTSLVGAITTVFILRFVRKLEAIIKKNQS